MCENYLQVYTEGSAHEDVEICTVSFCALSLGALRPGRLDHLVSSATVENAAIGVDLRKLWTHSAHDVVVMTKSASR